MSHYAIYLMLPIIIQLNTIGLFSYALVWFEQRYVKYRMYFEVFRKFELVGGFANFSNYRIWYDKLR